MAILNFPGTTGRPTDGSFTYTENNVIYSWNGTYWTANNASELEDNYVNRVGDNMTGDLTIGTNPASPNIELTAADGAASFDGNITTAGTIRINDASGDAQTYLTNDGSLNVAWGRLNSGLATYVSGSDGKHYIGFDGTTNSGTIKLDPADGSASFAGNITLPGGGSATQALQKQEIDGLIDSATYWDRDGTTLSPANDGDEVNFGNALVTPSGNIKAGDPDNSQGSVLSPIGQCYVRQDGGNSSTTAYAVYNGSLDSAGKFAAINFDGSAVFSQGNISFLADGTGIFSQDGDSRTLDISLVKTVGEGIGAAGGIVLGLENNGSIADGRSVGLAFRPGTGTGSAARGWINYVTGSGAHAGEFHFDVRTTDTGEDATALRITSNGDTLCQFWQANTTSSSANAFITGQGGIRRVTSAARYKTNVRTLSDTFSDKALELRPVVFNSLCESDDPSTDFLGFIAEEVVALFPEIGTYEEDGTVSGVQYDRVTPMLVNLIQRQNTRIEALEATNASLIERLTAVETTDL